MMVLKLDGIALFQKRGLLIEFFVFLPNALFVCEAPCIFEVLLEEMKIKTTPFYLRKV